MKNEVKHRTNQLSSDQKQEDPIASKNLRVIEEKKTRDNLKALKPTQDQPVPGVGAIFKKARESAGVTLEEASWTLRISKTYLEAIEGERSDVLPERVYALGFVRSYAVYVGLNPDAMVNQFKTEVLGDCHSEPLVFPAPESEVSGPRSGLLLLSTIVALFCIGGWYLYNHRAEPTVVKELPAELQKAIQQDFSAVEGEINGSASHKPKAAINQTVDEAPIVAPVQTSIVEAKIGLDAPIEENGPAEEGDPVDTSEGVDVSSVVSSNKAVPMVSGEGARVSHDPLKSGPQNSEMPAGIKTELGAAVPHAFESEGASVQPSSVTPTMIELTFLDKCWVEVRDGQQKIIIQKSFQKGDTYKLEAKPGRKLSLGNAGGVQMAVNGFKPRIIGGSGIVERISLDPLDLLKYSGAQR